MHDIEHNGQKCEFRMPVDGLECILEYRLDGPVMTITHTRVPDALGGRGLAGQITRHALEFARNQQWQVVPMCSYVAAYIRRNPQYNSLLHNS